MRVNENILISSLTTMRLGGPARFVIEIENPEEVPEAYEFAATYNLPTYILGGGANTIGHDDGFNGAILINRIRGITELDTTNQNPTLDEIEASLSDPQTPTTTIKVMGGENWDDVVQYTTDKGLTGIEALSKIPGLACSAPVQNIGAYGQEVATSIVSIDVFDSASHTFRTLSKDELKFSYRKSILNTTERGRYFVISITLALRPGQMQRPFYNSIERYISEHGNTDFSPAGIRQIVSAIRAEKLPDPHEIASAGSFFKNIYLTKEGAEKAEEKGFPVHHGQDGYKINSAWLIEKAGLASQIFNGFRVSEKAPLVLINESATSYNDLAKARDHIISTVYDKFGFWLEQEPVEIINPAKQIANTPGAS